MLSISTPVLFGRMHVAPLVDEFMRKYPSVRAQLHLSDHIANLVEEGLDVAIRIGHLPDSQLIARRLGVTRRIVVGSPGYLKRHGTPRHPSELAAHDMIAFTALLPLDWSFVENDTDLRVRVTPRYATNSGDAAVAYALKGGGLTAALCYQVQRALADKSLVEVLAPFAPAPLPIQAVYPSSRLLSSKVRRFVDMLEKKANWRLA